MPAEIDTLKLLEHIDRKFKDADDKRSAGLTAVHEKIDDHANEARASLAAFSETTTSALGKIAVELGKHETRIDAIETARSGEATRSDGWWKTGATIVLGGGGLAAFMRWLEGKS